MNPAMNVPPPPGSESPSSAYAPAPAPGAEIQWVSLPERGSRLSPVEWGMLLFAPLLAALVFQICPINQAETVDPWFYTGYSQAFRTLMNRHLYTYYAIRFPAIVPMWTAANTLGPIAGYVALRYLMFLAGGIPLYLLTRRHYGRAIAATAFLFLLCNPLFARIILWDYVNCFGVTYFLAGICIWYLSTPGGWGRFWACVLFTMAIFCHLFLITGVFFFLLTETLWAYWHSPSWREWFKAHALTGIKAAAMVLAVGYFAYVALIGKFYHPKNLFLPTYYAARQASGADGLVYVLPRLQWIPANYHCLVPYVFLLASILMQGRALLNGSMSSRITCFGMAYGGFYLFYEFVMNRFIFEWHFYFSYLLPAAFLLVPVVLHQLAHGMDGKAKTAPRVLAGFMAALVAWTLAHVYAGSLTSRLYDVLHGSLPSWGVFATIGVVLAVLVAVTRWRQRGAFAVALALAFYVQIAVYCNPSHRHLYGDRIHTEREWDSFEAATEFLDILRNYGQKKEKLFHWFTVKDSVTCSVAMCDTFGTLHVNWSTHGLPEVGAHEMKVLAENRPQYLLPMSTDPYAIDKGIAALRARGVQCHAEREYAWGGRQVVVYAVLLRVDTIPPLAAPTVAPLAAPESSMAGEELSHHREAQTSVR